jgi:general stress protein YciG
MRGPPRGFELLTPEERAELGARGGTIAQELGTAHRWTHDEAQQAGRRGGLTTQERRRRAKEPTE